jgi:hypothetical protein
MLIIKRSLKGIVDNNCLAKLEHFAFLCQVFWKKNLSTALSTIYSGDTLHVSKNTPFRRQVAASESLTFECQMSTKIREKIVRVAVVAVVAVIFRGVWVKFSIVKTGQDHFGQNRFLMRLRLKSFC